MRWVKGNERGKKPLPITAQALPSTELNFRSIARRRTDGTGYAPNGHMSLRNSITAPSFLQKRGICALGLAFQLLAAVLSPAQVPDELVGVWVIDEDWQITELLLRSDGRFQKEVKSTEPNGYHWIDRGRFEVNGQVLTMFPYDYLGQPAGTPYSVELSGGYLTLTTLDEFPIVEVYHYNPGSKEDVLAREQVAPVLIGTWLRTITFWGDEELTFRTGGYYIRKDTAESGEFPPEFTRGRYDLNESELIFTPYSGTAARYELDFFGDTLTFIRSEPSSGESKTYQKVPESEAVVRAKSAEADAFLSRDDWQVGVWQVDGTVFQGEMTFRPDGHYSATNSIEILRGIVRGRYELEPRKIRFLPFLGQGPYSGDNGDFGKVERTRVIDYYDGELQLIDLEALSQSVTLARKVAGSETTVMQKTQQAQSERERAGWQVGIWEVNDPIGWMEFTFRPDGRYIAKSGNSRIPGEVERGRHVFSTNKVTLAPYPGQGLTSPRGFELDLYDGNLFLVGDSHRMVVARKLPGSEAEVVAKTNDPESMKGEHGSILGLWTANLPGAAAQLVFRPDGQFRLRRCSLDALSWDYGLYSVDMNRRALVYDSRFSPAENRGLDFYGDTLTIHGGLSAPSTFKVNLGTVDASIAESLAEDAVEAQVDAQWLARVPIAPRDPNVVHVPGAGIPEDLNPGQVFESPTVFTGYHLYRRLILGFVYFNHLGNVVSVPVTNSREWHFFPTGRVLVRFRNHSAGPVYPTPIETITDSWGAYRVEPKPDQKDILHVYADNVVRIQTDLGETAEMTLEDGRRNLFWGKDYQLLSEWASERKPVPCEQPENPDPGLMNVGVSLSTTIPPDNAEETGQLQIAIGLSNSGSLTISGAASNVGALVLEHAASIAEPMVWQPVQTNSTSAGEFSFSVLRGTNSAGFFRVRRVP